MATTQRIESNNENTQDMRDTPSPRTTRRGHLALVEWKAPAAPAPAGRLARRASLDRLYDGGIVLLMLASTLAAIASFARL